MANTYVLIASNTLTSSAASVTFSSIPGTYTDLVVRFSVRDDASGTVDDNMDVVINGDDAATNYSFTLLSGNGSTPDSSRGSSLSYTRLSWVTAASATSNTFNNGELYIPSYLASQNKTMSSFLVAETNATAVRMGATSNLWRNTSAITSIKFVPRFGNNYVTGSSFWLYGIKKD